MQTLNAPPSVLSETGPGGALEPGHGSSSSGCEALQGADCTRHRCVVDCVACVCMCQRAGVYACKQGGRTVGMTATPRRVLRCGCSAAALCGTNARLAAGGRQLQQPTQTPVAAAAAAACVGVGGCVHSRQDNICGGRPQVCCSAAGAPDCGGAGGRPQLHRCGAFLWLQAVMLCACAGCASRLTVELCWLHVVPRLAGDNDHLQQLLKAVLDFLRHEEFSLPQAAADSSNSLSSPC